MLDTFSWNVSSESNCILSHTSLLDFIFSFRQPFFTLACYKTDFVLFLFGYFSWPLELNEPFEPTHTFFLHHDCR
jgi:hypothetical protein